MGVIYVSYGYRTVFGFDPCRSLSPSRRRAGLLIERGRRSASPLINRVERVGAWVSRACGRPAEHHLRRIVSSKAARGDDNG